MLNDLFFKVIFLLLGLALIIASAINATIGNASGGTICLVAGILTIILFQFDVKSFKVFGLAAELREKLTEADEILDKLRAISVPVSEIAISAASQSGGYQQHLRREQLHDYVSSISNALEQMKVSKQKIEGVKRGWYTATAVNMAVPVIQGIRYKLTSACAELEKINGEILSGASNYSADQAKEFDELYIMAQIELHEFDESMDLNKDYKSYPSFLNNLINNSKTLKPEVKEELRNRFKEELLDLDYLIEKQELRRPDVWFRY